MWWKGTPTLPAREVNTYGDLVEVVRATQSREDAQAFLAAYREDWGKKVVSLTSAISAADFHSADECVGYALGEFSHEEFVRLQALYGVEHPFFGDRPPIDPAAAFEAGMAMGEGASREQARRIAQREEEEWA